MSPVILTLECFPPPTMRVQHLQSFSADKGKLICTRHSSFRLQTEVFQQKDVLCKNFHEKSHHLPGQVRSSSPTRGFAKWTRDQPDLSNWDLWGNFHGLDAASRQLKSVEEHSNCSPAKKPPKPLSWMLVMENKYRSSANWERNGWL